MGVDTDAKRALDDRRGGKPGGENLEHKPYSQMQSDPASDERIVHEVCLAIHPLLGRVVTTSILSCDGATLACLGGHLERAFELPWLQDGLLLISVGGNSVRVRAERVAQVDQWSFTAFGRGHLNAAICFRDGTTVLIREDLDAPVA